MSTRVIARALACAAVAVLAVGGGVAHAAPLTAPAADHWTVKSYYTPEAATRTPIRSFAQHPCPAGTTAYTGSAQPFSCLRTYSDGSGHEVGLRQGRSDASGGAFGLLHTVVDHNVDEQSIGDVVDNSAGGILQSGTRYVYGATFRNGDGSEQLISLEIIEERAPSGASPDTYSLGVLTAYCRDGGSTAPIDQTCPDFVNATLN